MSDTFKQSCNVCEAFRSSCPVQEKKEVQEKRGCLHNKISCRL